MFGRRSRAEKLKKEARNKSFGTGVSLAAAYSGVMPVAERLLYDDDLRDNIRTLIEATRKIVAEVSDEEPTEVVTRLWDDPKLRREVESAVEAFQDGSKRIRGQRVGGGGGRSFRRLLLILILAAGILFLNPKTGPQARSIASDVFGALRPGS